MKSQRSLLPFSDVRRRDALLRDAFMKIVASFDCRPEPRSTWDETNTSDLTPWKAIVHPTRAAILAAVAEGNQEKINTTLEGARAFCRELEADFVSLVPSTEEESILTLALEETKHQGPADEAAMALAAKASCPIEAERAIGPVSRHATAVAALLNSLRRHARQPQMRVAR